MRGIQLTQSPGRRLQVCRCSLDSTAAEYRYTALEDEIAAVKRAAEQQSTSAIKQQPSPPESIIHDLDVLKSSDRGVFDIGHRTDVRHNGRLAAGLRAAEAAAEAHYRHRKKLGESSSDTDVMQLAVRDHVRNESRVLHQIAPVSYTHLTLPTKA